MPKKKIRPGIYLVVDPAMERPLLLRKLAEVMTREIMAVQIWDHFPAGSGHYALINDIYEICSKSDVPLLINNHWEYLKTIGLDGVHFDKLPSGLSEIKAETGRDFITGITCENNLSEVRRAAESGVDYISFCSMFPSRSAIQCELVRFETVQKARRLFSGLLFLTGGIYPQNMDDLNSLPYDGIAVISGIMHAIHPAQEADAYIQKIKSRS